MAVKFFDWALDQNIPHSPKFVLYVLANYANEEGKCWPSYTLLQQKCSMSKPSLIKNIRILIKQGLITKTSRSEGIGKKKSNIYHLTCV